MCQSQERPQRRHRAVYLAPSVGQLQHQQQASPEPPHNFASAPPSLGELGIPLLLEVPVSAPLVGISPPSSGELSADNYQQHILPNVGRRTWRQQVWDALVGICNGFVDLVLLVFVCFMGCFFYDVEVKVVKADRPRTRARGGRVVLRTDKGQQQGYHQQIYHQQQTSLLRTPPRSTRSNTSVRSRENITWDHIV